LGDEAVAAWTAEPRTTRGGQQTYSALAILTALTLRAVFWLALRQTEGLIGSVIRLLRLDLAVPGHSSLSRRAETLEVPRLCSSAGAEPMHLLVDSTGLSCVDVANCQQLGNSRKGQCGILVFWQNGKLATRRFFMASVALSWYLLAIGQCELPQGGNCQQCGIRQGGSCTPSPYSAKRVALGNPP